MPLNSTLELFTLLLYVDDNKPIKGKTRLTKLLFLLIKDDLFKNLEQEADFDANNFGPWSYTTGEDIPNTLKDLGIISIEKENQEFSLFSNKSRDDLMIYKITDKGKEVAQKIISKITNEELILIEKIKSTWNSKTTEELISYVYHNFISYTNKSKIREKIFKGTDFDPELLEVVGIIQVIPLEDEKEYIKKVLAEKYL